MEREVRSLAWGAGSRRGLGRSHLDPDRSGCSLSGVPTSVWDHVCPCHSSVSRVPGAAQHRVPPSVGAWGTHRARTLELGSRRIRMCPRLGPLILFVVSPVPLGIFTPFSALTSSSSGRPARSSQQRSSLTYTPSGFCVCPRTCPAGPAGEAHQTGVSRLPGPALSPGRPLVTRLFFQRPLRLPQWPLAWLCAFGHVILFVLAAVSGAHRLCLWVVEDFFNVNSCLWSPWLRWGWPHPVLGGGSVRSAGHGGQNGTARDTSVVGPGERLFTLQASAEPWPHQGLSGHAGQSLREGGGGRRVPSLWSSHTGQWLAPHGRLSDFDSTDA
ncbi:uncharacterized protein LOC122207712 isoform X2 [Panthera leo]|uniref:uncharacterized protein LOC122207712 isoform X2 n=1 Tax=Panthera leo TaxID=9689 RepID=UPI001C69B8A1|nr:uncharacterized protein LOC122207712 isoform X2 [Panthera leo]